MNDSSSVNELSLKDLVATYGSSYSNTFAVTTTWASTSTGIISKAAIEVNNKWSWSLNADPSGPDVQNILTHEFGHWLRLLDIYSPATCGDVTMWGSAAFGETKKRTLEQPDIDGFLSLYEGTPATVGAPVLEFSRKRRHRRRGRDCARMDRRRQRDVLRRVSRDNPIARIGGNGHRHDVPARRPHRRVHLLLARRREELERQRELGDVLVYRGRGDGQCHRRADAALARRRRNASFPHPAHAVDSRLGRLHVRHLHRNLAVAPVDRIAQCDRGNRDRIPIRRHLLLEGRRPHCDKLRQLGSGIVHDELTVARPRRKE